MSPTILFSEARQATTRTHRALMENRGDMRHERHVMVEDRNVVSHAEHESGCLRMLGDEPRNSWVLGHEPRKARMRVVEGR